MQLVLLQNAIIKAFMDYDINHLVSIDSTVTYSFNFKNEFIQELSMEIEKLKSDYPDGLYTKESMCLFCYPASKAFSFYSKKSGEYVMRYVIDKDESQFIVHRCENNPIPDGENGTPF